LFLSFNVLPVHLFMTRTALLMTGVLK